MKSFYRADLKAHVTLDDRRRTRHILHTQEYALSDMTNSRVAASDYLNKMAGEFKIPKKQLQQLHKSVSFLEPRRQDIEYQLYETKKQFASTTHCFYQTIHNVPVWRSGMSVTVKDNPLRITHAEHQGHDDLELELPSDKLIAAVQAALVSINTLGGPPAQVRKRRAALERARSVGDTAPTFAKLFGERPDAGERASNRPDWMGELRLTRGLFYVYRYDAEQRVPKHAIDFLHPRKQQPDFEAGEFELTLPLPEVPEQVRHGEFRLVVELVFHLASKPRLKWKALLDVETQAFLWLRAMVSGVDGLVFPYCPMTLTGNTAMTPASSSTVLNPLRGDVTLTNLDSPASGVQSLTGTLVTVVDDDLPTIAPPTEATGTDFDYDARTNDFAAVSAYFHPNRLFGVIEDLGFDLTTYFDGTSFPVHVDHRGSLSSTTGIETNAACMGDGPTGYTGDGIGLVTYMLSDLSDTTNPLGRAVDSWVHWHEIGGHGILWDHVNSPNFGFAHSAGDSLAAFNNDPVSQLRGLPERFRYAPFRSLDRWFNREVADGWGWGGTKDGGGYNSEQILATTLFRFYRAVGGDSTSEADRWRASALSTYLVLNAVGKLSPATNPSSPLAFYNHLVDADDDDWTTKGWAGGAYHKVLRWAFEKQGLWRAPGDPTTEIGQPPEVDLYIDDGRGGEYDYKAVHYHNTSVWNRTIADGGTEQQPGVAGVTSYAYVRVKNRGTTDANGIVRVYHCKPGAGLTWPTDFVQAGSAAGLPTGTVQANNGNDVIVGPFAWTPNVNYYGHDCLLAIVHADGDPSNVDNLEAGQTIQEWRLVPHDNNVGQRNVQLVPGGGGGESLGEDLDGVAFQVGNNFNKPADFSFEIELPRILAARGWGVKLEGVSGGGLRLRAGEKQDVRIRLVRGQNFSAADVRATSKRDISIVVRGDGMLIGGMSYRLDPDMIHPRPRGPIERPKCLKPAQALVDCLDVSGGRKVKKVTVKKVTVDISLDDDCCE